jgi:hypothetical protein
MPAARDDLSVLGDDVFSNLIRRSYSEKLVGDKVTGGYLGVSQLDREKAELISRQLLQEKTMQEVIDLFIRENGQCSSMALDSDKVIQCEVIRKWKLKNIGAPTDTSNWPEPAAKLVYRLSFSESNVISGVDMAIYDITEKTKY